MLSRRDPAFASFANGYSSYDGLDVRVWAMSDENTRVCRQGSLPMRKAVRMPQMLSRAFVHRQDPLPFGGRPGCFVTYGPYPYSTANNMVSFRLIL